MTALAALGHASAAGALSILVWLLIAIVIVGIVYWAASALLPHPWPVLIALLVALILLLYWL